MLYNFLGARPGPSMHEDLRMIAVARLFLRPWITNIQVSWVKMGHKLGQMAMHAGANDFGGTLMEESISRESGLAARREHERRGVPAADPRVRSHAGGAIDHLRGAAALRGSRAGPAVAASPSEHRDLSGPARQRSEPRRVHAPKLAASGYS